MGDEEEERWLSAKSCEDVDLDSREAVGPNRGRGRRVERARGDWDILGGCVPEKSYSLSSPRLSQRRRKSERESVTLRNFQERDLEHPLEFGFSFQWILFYFLCFHVRPHYLAELKAWRSSPEAASRSW